MPIYSNSHYRVEDVNTITPHKIDEADANTTYMCYLAISASAGEAAEIYGSSSLSGHRKQRIVRIKKVGNVTSYDQAIDVTWTGKSLRYIFTSEWTEYGTTSICTHLVAMLNNFFN